MFFIPTDSYSSYEKLAYSFSFNGIDDKIINFNDYQGKVIEVVNVASRCGFTNQYEDLQNLWTKYENAGLIIVGVPTNNFKQEPGSNSEIKDFCETNFGVNFPMSAKVDVIGAKAHPFYKWAKKNYGLSAVPKWNFHKIVIDKNGKIIDTFSSVTKPSSKKFVKLIEQEIKK